MPIAGWLRGYRPAWLRADLLAGAATAAVVIPQAMAYAGVAGLPVQAGLYCALVPMALYALLGTSRPLSVSTTSTISLLTATAIASAPKGSDPGVVASLLALEVGGLLVVAGVLRLGFVSDFISRPVLDGFKIGMGLSIAASQLGKVLGVDVQGETFFPKVLSALQQLGDINVPTLALATGVVVALIVIRRVAPGVPGPLLVLVGATLRDGTHEPRGTRRRDRRPGPGRVAGARRADAGPRGTAPAGGRRHRADRVRRVDRVRASVPAGRRPAGRSRP